MQQHPLPPDTPPSAGFVKEHGPFKVSFKGGKDADGSTVQKLQLDDNPYTCVEKGTPGGGDWAACQPAVRGPCVAAAFLNPWLSVY